VEVGAGFEDVPLGHKHPVCGGSAVVEDQSEEGPVSDSYAARSVIGNAG
jgi:hypothetical protein